MTGSDISGVTQENNEQSASQEEPRITLDISGISHPETSPVDSIPKVSDSTNRMSTTALLASGNLPPNKPDGTDSLASLNSSSRGKIPPKSTKWLEQPEYILFSNEIKNIKKSNMIILKECKEAKRLLDLKYGDLTAIINRIQTSVIILSTIAGFFNATKVQFGLQDQIISVMSIVVSTYVSLVLSVSKYFKYDESKENIQTLREKYSMLHNQIEHRMDVLGPWNDPNLWKFADPVLKLQEWDQIKQNMEVEYNDIINTKQKLTTEFEITMDTKSRNAYHINNRKLTYDNRVKLFEWAQKEMDLDDKIDDVYIEHDKKKAEKVKKNGHVKRRHSLQSEHEKMTDNWDEHDEDSDGDSRV
uniref:SMODS and SLOG-associating 2TM effector domain-containing protein n=1 Tax=viral metagenome TaxID=1070528 RepID=A0A6C0FDZ8_9ZZZZ|tara:strand:+ start:5130 stop:6206 length:1077 start_codon:yes stop_codon:yes gene_type:complete